MSRIIRTLRRPGPVLAIPLCVFIAAAVAYVAASGRPTAYSAQALAVVNPTPQLTPDQAKGLAVTYAALIPDDTAIERAVADSLDTLPRNVDGRISVFNPPDTAVLQIQYRGATPASARSGALAVLLSLTGGHPASFNITPRSVGVISPPAQATASKNVKENVVIAGILGLALGALVMVALRRADPRVEDDADVSADADCPVSSFDALSDDGARALMDRWKALAGLPRLSVALVPVTDDLRPDLRRIVARFTQAEETAESLAFGEDARYVVRSFTPTVGPSVLIPGSVPGDSSSGEALAMACDVTVLVVPRGARRSDVWRAVDILGTFGVAPVWAIVFTHVETPLEPPGATPAPTLRARQPA